MANASQTHTIALVGHGGCGKTTLTESLLFAAKAISRRGSVTDGTSVGLVSPEEKERQITLNCNVFNAERKGHRIQFLDAPGYADFIAGSIQALSAADLALICISASAGIEVNTRKMWNLIENLGIPCAIAITKMDSDTADFNGVLESIKEVFSTSATPLFLPDKSGPAFSSIVSVLNAPDDHEEAQGLKEELMESIVEADDKLLERYLGEDEISDEELGQAFENAISAGTVIPVIPVSGEKDIGVEEFLDVIASSMPSASGKTNTGKAGPGEDDEETTREATEDAPFSGQVFRVMSDKFVGKMSFFRVLSGTYSSSTPIYNARIGKATKIGGLFRIQGGEQETVDKLGPGEIGAISKVEDIEVSDTLCDQGNPIIYEPISFPIPMVALAVEPKARGDEQKISTALSSLTQEDPTFVSNRQQETHELIMSGIGTLHLEVMMDRMKQRFDLEVITKVPTVPYLETITANAESHYRHKKQTGGRGQFAEIYIRMVPSERGSGYEFEDKIFGGSIPNNFIPAVDKGIQEAITQGAFAGFPAVDFKVELYDGGFHAVDSDEHSFKLAARNAFREGFLKAKPVLLEPIVNLEVSVPSRFMGEITSDMNRRRGRIQGMDALGDTQIIKASVPLAEVVSYSTELRSITGGEGDFTIEPSHHDIVPTHIAQEIQAKSKRVHQEDE